ncbi:hypothetical protein V8C42DRAFT_326238 [Trichoderma barbatum]
MFPSRKPISHNIPASHPRRNQLLVRAHVILPTASYDIPFPLSIDYRACPCLDSVHHPSLQHTTKPTIKEKKNGKRKNRVMFSPCLFFSPTSHPKARHVSRLSQLSQRFRIPTRMFSSESTRLENPHKGILIKNPPSTEHMCTLLSPPLPHVTRSPYMPLVEAVQVGPQKAGKLTARYALLYAVVVVLERSILLRACTPNGMTLFVHVISQGRLPRFQKHAASRQVQRGETPR